MKVSQDLWLKVGCAGRITDKIILSDIYTKVILFCWSRSRLLILKFL